MKHFYLKCLLFGIFSLMGIRAAAFDCKVDGIYYDLNTTAKTARVTYKDWVGYVSDYKGSVTIPSSFTYIGTTYSVTSIGDHAFYNCSGLTSVTIPNSATSIGEGVFSNCSGLTSVTIPNSVTSIGKFTFYGCIGLTSVTIPNGVTSIGDHAFEYCSGLTSVEIPNSVTSIGSEAFYGCSGLTSLTIGNSVTNIGNHAFHNCSGLTSIVVASDNTVYDSRNGCKAIIETATNTLIAGCMNTTIPNSVTSIGDYAFYNCSGLTSIEIPNSVTSIGDYAFYNCSGLTSIEIPNSVTSIEDDAFDGCSGLISLTIGNSVTSIGNYAFHNCSGLTSIVVASGNTVYDSRNGCKAIIETATNTLIVGCMNTTIPNSVTSIGDYAFCYCSGLTSVTIPNSVTSIGDYAFSGCKLENVLARNPRTKGEKSFSDRTYQHAMCYVPEGTWGIAVYDGDWYRFNNIRELAMGKDALSSQKVYTMMETQSFSYVIYDEASNEAKMVKAFYNVDEEDPNYNWQIIEHAGNTYLYNIGAKQYACLTEDGKIALTATATPIELDDGENGVVLGSNSSSQWGFVVNKAFGTGETSIVLPTDGSNQNAVYYGIDGQQLSSPRKGLNIVKEGNGKTRKIFVR